MAQKNAPEKKKFSSALGRNDPAELRRLESKRQVLANALKSARDMSYLHGAGLGEIANSPLACLPSSIPGTRTRQMPMPEEEFRVNFPPEFSLLPENASTQNTGLVSKLTNGGSPLAPFFMRAVGLIARVDPAMWALIGAAVTRPTSSGAPPIRTPRVVPVGGVPDDANARPAIFEWNHQAIQGLMYLLLSFQFQYLLQGRFLMINERAMDVGFVDSQTFTQGFGCADSDPGLMINEANRWLGEAFGDDFPIFQQPLVTATGEGQGSPLEPALVRTQYGAVLAPGVFGSSYPVKPHVLFPGQNYQFLLTQINEGLYYERLRRAWTTDGTLTKADDLFADTRAAGAGGPAVWSGYQAFRYAAIQYGVILRGAEVLPEECMQWLLAFGQPYMSVISQPEVWAQVDMLARQCGMNGVPQPLGLKGVDKRWENTIAIDAMFRMLGGQGPARFDANGGLAGIEFNPGSVPQIEMRELMKAMDKPLTNAEALAQIPAHLR